MQQSKSWQPDHRELGHVVIASSSAIAVVFVAFRVISSVAVDESRARALCEMHEPPLMYERVTGSYDASEPGQHDVSVGMSDRQPSAKPVRHGSIKVVGRRW
jgi:hypothetical protein